MFGYIVHYGYRYHYIIAINIITTSIIIIR